MTISSKWDAAFAGIMTHRRQKFSQHQTLPRAFQIVAYGRYSPDQLSMVGMSFGSGWSLKTVPDKSVVTPFGVLEFCV
ncbi:hypothetical protein CLCR_05310 [Cladophialophora carrionii]|uniref:Uncharacterized protein n=1 Tax=Cladophialophora carrionii TaxID=86049 RepID=A0A1C1CKP9_9EURO|nr:hypothetical protein CLCR_05310 [Cladophialophora carrionii]